MRAGFPRFVSYSRFVALISLTAPFLLAFLDERRARRGSWLSVADATKLEVCRAMRAGQHKVFARMAAWGKTGQGFFLGLRFHLLVNHRGEVVAFSLTPGNVDDRNRRVMSDLVKGLRGYLLGDKGYLDRKLSYELLAKGLRLLAPLRQIMKRDGRTDAEVALMRKRGIVERVFHLLKDVLRIAHTRHRSPSNFVAHLLAGLVTYEFYPFKPAISLAGSGGLGAQMLPKFA